MSKIRQVDIDLYGKYELFQVWGLILITRHSILIFNIPKISPQFWDILWALQNAVPFLFLALLKPRIFEPLVYEWKNVPRKNYDRYILSQSNIHSSLKKIGSSNRQKTKFQNKPDIISSSATTEGGGAQKLGWTFFLIMGYLLVPKWKKKSELGPQTPSYFSRPFPSFK